MYFFFNYLYWYTLNKNIYVRRVDITWAKYLSVRYVTRRALTLNLRLRDNNTVLVMNCCHAMITLERVSLTMGFGIIKVWTQLTLPLPIFTFCPTLSRSLTRTIIKQICWTYTFFIIIYAVTTPFLFFNFDLMKSSYFGRESWKNKYFFKQFEIVISANSLRSWLCTFEQFVLEILRVWYVKIYVRGCARTFKHRLKVSKELRTDHKQFPVQLDNVCTSVFAQGSVTSSGNTLDIYHTLVLRLNYIHRASSQDTSYTYMQQST